ncbi:MAG TPA: hypothetical protein VHR66_06480 [Gemmataceae bacterium]|nr:hypothetical protein [Gemmataceae bacterium]
MPLLSKPAFGPRTAIIYITVGSLVDVWTAVWYFVYARDDHGAISRNTWFWLVGLFLSGLTVIAIGFFLGRIGQAARKAELPPKEAQQQETNIQETAAAHPQPVMAGAIPGVGTAMAGAAPMMSNAMPAMPAQPQLMPQVARR